MKEEMISHWRIFQRYTASACCSKGARATIRGESQPVQVPHKRDSAARPCDIYPLCSMDKQTEYIHMRPITVTRGAPAL